MDYGRIPGIDVPVSRLIQGTLRLGQMDPDAAFAFLDGVLEAGCTAFDTAAVYARGASESVLGDWLERRGVRDRVVVIGKGCHPVFGSGVERVTPEDLRADLTASLERLRIDAIDLYLLHRDDPKLHPGIILEALNEERAKGRIRAFGASNWTHERLAQANEYAHARGLVPFVASSPGFSLAHPVTLWPGCVSIHPTHTPEAIAWYRETRLPVLAWSPLASGFFGGRYARNAQTPPEDSWERTVLDFYGSEENFERLERLARLAQRRGVTVAQAALAYVFHFELDLYAVIGPKSAPEFATCSEALAIRFSAEELAELEPKAP
nr:MAG: aldo/keto reductase [Pseudomonadota bacterium]